MSTSNDNNVPVRKYSVTFELEVYAPSPGIAYAAAIDHMVEIVMKHRKLRVWEIVSAEDLPTGGVEGEPHRETLDGWRCIYRIGLAL